MRVFPHRLVRFRSDSTCHALSVFIPLLWFRLSLLRSPQRAGPVAIPVLPGPRTEPTTRNPVRSWPVHAGNRRVLWRDSRQRCSNRRSRLAETAFSHARGAVPPFAGITASPSRPPTGGVGYELKRWLVTEQSSSGTAGIERVYRKTPSRRVSRIRVSTPGSSFASTRSPCEHGGGSHVTET